MKTFSVASFVGSLGRRSQRKKADDFWLQESLWEKMLATATKFYLTNGTCNTSNTECVTTASVPRNRVNP